jgi:hypothetical protein
MEVSIFDYKISKEELRLIFCPFTEKGEYLVNTSEKKRLHDLYLLFKIREDVLRAGKISEKIFKKKEACVI